MIARLIAALSGQPTTSADQRDAASELAAVTEQLHAAQGEIRLLGTALALSEKGHRTSDAEVVTLRATVRELTERLEKRQRPDRMVAPSGDPDAYLLSRFEHDRRNAVALEDRLAAAEGRPATRSAV